MNFLIGQLESAKSLVLKFHYSKRRQDGLVINGKFTPGRTCNSMWGTRSPHKLAEHLRQCSIVPHYDEGKFLYWKPIKRTGILKAKSLKLEKLEYPKPLEHRIVK